MRYTPEAEVKSSIAEYGKANALHCALVASAFHKRYGDSSEADYWDRVIDAIKNTKEDKMTKPTMTWLKTADGVPEFEEVKGRMVATIGNLTIGCNRIEDDYDYRLTFEAKGVLWYIIIDPPVEEPLEYKGKKPEVYKLGMDVCWHVSWMNGNEAHRFSDPDKAKAIAEFNRFVRGE